MPLLESCSSKCNRKLHSFVCELWWPTCNRTILVSYTHQSQPTSATVLSSVALCTSLSITQVAALFSLRIVRKCWSVFCFVCFSLVCLFASAFYFDAVKMFICERNHQLIPVRLKLHSLNGIAQPILWNVSQMVICVFHQHLFRMRNTSNEMSRAKPHKTIGWFSIAALQHTQCSNRIPFTVFAR